MHERGQAAYEVLRHVRPLHQYSARAVTDALAGTPVTVGMRAMLERLHDDGPQTVPQIARALWITRQGVQRVVDDARSEGYVESRDNPAHARSKLIALTDQGRAVFEQLHRQELATLDDLLADLDPVELHACADVLGRFTARVRNDSESTLAHPSVTAADSPSLGGQRPASG